MRAKTKGKDRDVGRPSPRHYEAKPQRANLISATAGERAAEALAGFERGGRVITLSLGQWDKSDWAEAMAALIGPGKVERVTISTWTAKPEHAPRIARLCGDVRWLLDPTMAQREADVVAAILEQFGEGRVALLANHAKFICMEGDGWYLSSTTSSNLELPGFRGPLSIVQRRCPDGRKTCAVRAAVPSPDGGVGAGRSHA